MLNSWKSSLFIQLPIDEREKSLLSHRFAGEKKNDMVVRQSTQSLGVLVNSVFV